MWGNGISSGPKYCEAGLVWFWIGFGPFEVCPQIFNDVYFPKCIIHLDVLLQTSKAEFCGEDVGEVCLGDSSIKAIFMQVPLTS